MLGTKDTVMTKKDTVSAVTGLLVQCGPRKTRKQAFAYLCVQAVLLGKVQGAPAANLALGYHRRLPRELMI